MDEYERKALRLVLSVAVAVLAALIYVGLRWGEVGVVITFVGLFALLGVALLTSLLYAVTLMLSSAIGGYLRSRD